MKQTTFGELGQGDTFYLKGSQQEFEKIAPKHIQEIFSWTPIRSMVNARWYPWCGPFTDKPEKYTMLDNAWPVFIEEQGAN